MNSRTRAVLSPDGKHYILNGEKMWITNAHFADLFTVFAKVDGEKFTAFLVEKDFPGFSVGAEEKKMGIRGSSTAPLILNDCKVPVENVLGEIGKGHIIAFNILNVGRFKLGAGCVGGARTSLQNAIAYAKERKAFGKTISDFGLIREKLAQMAVGIYAGESMVYRTVGMMENAMPEGEKSSEVIRKAIEEYAVECSIIKVAGSEMLDFVVDETVQIYGGYGFVEEYPAERAYRDSRVNRIFEGTNEINRLIITGWLLKRAMSGQLALLPAIKKTMDEVMAGPSFEELEGTSGGRTEDRRQRQEAGHARSRCGFAEVHAEAGRPAGNHGRDCRHGDRVVCHGFLRAAGAQAHRDPRRAEERAGDRDDADLHRGCDVEARSCGKEGDRGRGRRRHDAHPDGDRPPPGEVRAGERDRLAGADRRPRARDRQVCNGLEMLEPQRHRDTEKKKLVEITLCLSASVVNMMLQGPAV